jgi:hypothetical protein
MWMFKYGIIALIGFLIGLGVGFNNSRWQDMKDIAATCTTQQESQHLMTQAYREALSQCLRPFKVKKGK